MPRACCKDAELFTRPGDKVFCWNRHRNPFEGLWASIREPSPPRMDQNQRLGVGERASHDMVRVVDQAETPMLSELSLLATRRNQLAQPTNVSRRPSEGKLRVAHQLKHRVPAQKATQRSEKRPAERIQYDPASHNVVVPVDRGEVPVLSELSILATLRNRLARQENVSRNPSEGKHRVAHQPKHRVSAQRAIERSERIPAKRIQSDPASHGIVTSVNQAELPVLSEVSPLATRQNQLAGRQEDASRHPSEVKHRVAHQAKHRVPAKRVIERTEKRPAKRMQYDPALLKPVKVVASDCKRPAEATLRVPRRPESKLGYMDRSAHLFPNDGRKENKYSSIRSSASSGERISAEISVKSIKSPNLFPSGYDSDDSVFGDLTF